MTTEPTDINGTTRSKALEVYIEAMQRRLNPTWRELVWTFLASGTKLVVQYTLIGAALRLGWGLLR